MNTQNTALLVMDMQTAITGLYPASGAAITNVAKAIAHARNNNISVIYVVVGFRKGMPEVGATNKTFTASKQRMGNADPSAMTKIDPPIAPLDTDIIVTKKRYSAFAGSDLELVLRGLDTKHLVLAGVATSGVVLSTVCEAADKDYVLTVLSDACADGDEEVHQVLTTKVFVRRADVVTVQQWIGE